MKSLSTLLDFGIDRQQCRLDPKSGTGLVYTNSYPKAMMLQRCGPHLETIRISHLHLARIRSILELCPNVKEVGFTAVNITAAIIDYLRENHKIEALRYGDKAVNGVMLALPMLSFQVLWGRRTSRSQNHRREATLGGPQPPPSREQHTEGARHRNL